MLLTSGVGSLDAPRKSACATSAVVTLKMLVSGPNVFLGQNIRLAAIPGKVVDAARTARRSGENQASPFRFWNRIAKFHGGVSPQADRILRVAECGFLRVAVRHASRKFRHVGYKHLVFFAPVNDNFVFDLWHRSSKPMAASAVPLRTRPRAFPDPLTTFYTMSSLAFCASRRVARSRAVL